MKVSVHICLTNKWWSSINPHSHTHTLLRALYCAHFLPSWFSLLFVRSHLPMAIARAGFPAPWRTTVTEGLSLRSMWLSTRSTWARRNQQWVQIWMCTCMCDPPNLNTEGMLAYCIIHFDIMFRHKCNYFGMLLSSFWRDEDCFYPFCVKSSLILFEGFHSLQNGPSDFVCALFETLLDKGSSMQWDYFPSP